MDYSPPGSSVQGITQARILEHVVISCPGDLSNPGIRLMSLESPALADRFFTTPSLGKHIHTHIYTHTHTQTCGNTYVHAYMYMYLLYIRTKFQITRAKKYSWSSWSEVS